MEPSLRAATAGFLEPKREYDDLPPPTPQYHRYVCNNPSLLVTPVLFPVSIRFGYDIYIESSNALAQVYVGSPRRHTLDLWEIRQSIRCGWTLTEDRRAGCGGPCNASRTKDTSDLLLLSLGLPAKRGVFSVAKLERAWSLCVPSERVARELQLDMDPKEGGLAPNLAQTVLSSAPRSSTAHHASGGQRSPQSSDPSLVVDGLAVSSPSQSTGKTASHSPASNRVSLSEIKANVGGHNAPTSSAHVSDVPARF